MGGLVGGQQRGSCAQQCVLPESATASKPARQQASHHTAQACNFLANPPLWHQICYRMSCS